MLGATCIDCGFHVYLEKLSRVDLQADVNAFQRVLVGFIPTFVRFIDKTIKAFKSVE